MPATRLCGSSSDCRSNGHPPALAFIVLCSVVKERCDRSRRRHLDTRCRSWRELAGGVEPRDFPAQPAPWGEESMYPRPRAASTSATTFLGISRRWLSRPRCAVRQVLSHRRRRRLARGPLEGGRACEGGARRRRFQGREPKRASRQRTDRRRDRWRARHPHRRRPWRVPAGRCWAPRPRATRARCQDRHPPYRARRR